MRQPLDRTEARLRAASRAAARGAQRPLIWAGLSGNECRPVLVAFAD
jgi:hypothetical protein